MVDRARCGTGPSLLAFGNLETDMTPEQIELPTVSNVDQDLQHEPDIREGYVLVGGPVKWMPYKPQGAKHTKRKGRWQAMNEYGGWDNCETPAQIWSGFISYEEMAAHIIAQREQIAALEARVKAADRLQLDAQMMAQMIADSLEPTGPQNVAICPDGSRTLNDAFKTLAAFRATGEAP